MALPVASEKIGSHKLLLAAGNVALEDLLGRIWGDGQLQISRKTNARRAGHATWAHEEMGDLFRTIQLVPLEMLSS